MSSGELMRKQRLELEAANAWRLRLNELVHEYAETARHARLNGQQPETRRLVINAREALLAHARTAVPE